MSDSGFSPNPDDNIIDSLFQQYEHVIIESLITSFGLDFLIKDQHGGDVDTIHNVRQIGKDEQMSYKNSANETAYDERGNYSSTTLPISACGTESEQCTGNSGRKSEPVFECSERSSWKSGK